MGEILDFKTGERVDEPQTDKEVVMDTDFIDPELRELRQEVLTLTLQRIEDMQSFFAEAGGVSIENIQPNEQKEIESMSLEQMCIAVANSNEEKIKLRPGYYRALSERFTPEVVRKILRAHLLSPRSGKK